MDTIDYYSINLKFTSRFMKEQLITRFPLVLSAMLCSGFLLFGCGEKSVQICNSKDVLESIKKDFNYEYYSQSQRNQIIDTDISDNTVIYKNSHIPSVTFSIIEIEPSKKMSSMQTCVASIEIKAKPSEMVKFLKMKYGNNRFAKELKNLKSNSNQKLEPNKILRLPNRTKNIYLLQAIIDLLPTIVDRENLVKIPIVYVVDKSKETLISVDYKSNVFQSTWQQYNYQ